MRKVRIRDGRPKTVKRMLAEAVVNKEGASGVSNQ